VAECLSLLGSHCDCPEFCSTGTAFTSGQPAGQMMADYYGSVRAGNNERVLPEGYPVHEAAAPRKAENFSLFISAAVDI